MAIIHKEHSSEFTQDLVAVLSDLTPDHYQDIVGDPADPMLGWDVADFRRNPIALWSHDSRSPIGTWRDVHVKDRALRGQLTLAPPGSTKLVDELRSLLAASVLKGISVGFKPVESKPRSNGGTHYLRQTLVEASLVSIPANPSALLCAKALGISKETIAKIFKPTDTSSTAQRIRGYRRSIQKFKDKIARETNPKTRASMMRALAALERAEREECGNLDPREREADRRREVRARVEAAQDRELDRLIAEYEASWTGQVERHTAETIEAYTRQALKHRDPPPYVPSNGNFTTWRGQKIDLRLTWRGKKI